jgi:DNA-binding MarR family transcriptional regulator
MQTFTADDLAADLARDLVAVAIHVFKESSQEYYELVDELDLSITQTRALNCLDRLQAEVSVNELAEVIGLSVPATSRTVESLLRRGYIERREDEHDRRVKRVQVNSAGRALVARMNAARMAGMEEFTGTLSPTERSHLRRALASIVARPVIAACRPQPARVYADAVDRASADASPPHPPHARPDPADRASADPGPPPAASPADLRGAAR